MEYLFGKNVEGDTKTIHYKGIFEKTMEIFPWWIYLISLVISIVSIINYLGKKYSKQKKRKSVDSNYFRQ